MSFSCEKIQLYVVLQLSLYAYQFNRLCELCAFHLKFSGLMLPPFLCGSIWLFCVNFINLRSCQISYFPVHVQLTYFSLLAWSVWVTYDQSYEYLISELSSVLIYVSPNLLLPRYYTALKPRPLIFTLSKQIAIFLLKIESKYLKSTHLSKNWDNEQSIFLSPTMYMYLWRWRTNSHDKSR